VSLRILIDTREQLPLKFKCVGALTETVRATLPVGDYAAEYTDGTRCPIYFERKSLSDLWGTMTSGYARFKKEMQRAKEADLKLVLVIEGSFTQVACGIERSKYSGESMVRKLLTLWLKYDLMPVFCDSREGMAYMIREFYEAFGRNFKVKNA
jgi:ERCC4-type nuclease